MTANTSIKSTALITSWAEFKRLSGISADTDKDIYPAYINQATELIEQYCSRLFSSRKFGPEFYSSGNIISLANYPLLSIPVIRSGVISLETTSGSSTASGTTTSLSDSARTEATGYWNGAEIFITTTSGSAPERSQVLTYASNVFTLKPEYALLNSVASGDYYELAHYNTTGAYTLMNTDIADIDYNAGIIRLNGKYAEITIEYWAGYIVIPSALKMACALTARNINVINRNQGITNASMGNKSVTREKAQPEFLTPEVKAMIDQYRDIARII